MNARYIGKFVVILRNFVFFYLCMVDLNTKNISSQTLSQPNWFSLSHFHFFSATFFTFGLGFHNIRKNIGRIEWIHVTLYHKAMVRGKY